MFGGRAVELSASDQPLELHAWRAGHDHDGIAQGFTTGFIEKRNVSKEKIGGVAMAFGFEAPLTADARMQDLLQRAFLFRVGEDYRAKLPPVQVAACRLNPRPKVTRNESPYLRIALGQSARRVVRIKKGRGGNNLAETVAKGRLTRGNPTRDPNRRHIGSFRQGHLFVTWDLFAWHHDC